MKAKYMRMCRSKVLELELEKSRAVQNTIQNIGHHLPKFIDKQ